LRARPRRPRTESPDGRPVISAITDAFFLTVTRRRPPIPGLLRIGSLRITAIASMGLANRHGNTLILVHSRIGFRPLPPPEATCNRPRPCNRLRR
jgi:hypothetical protein